HTYRYDDPAAEMSAYLTERDYPADVTLGLMTAAKLTHASIAEEAGDRFRVVVCTTAGTRNAAKAGMPRTVFSACRPGTINTLIFLDCKMTDAALLGVVITATEAKCSALADLDIRDEEAQERLATGTTTDAVVAAVTQRAAHRLVHEYAGSASEIGNAVGRLVYATVHEASATQHES
ncbi:adenosylcobinamide amidohydrolase, partial [Paenibacillus darwinianus]